MNEEELLKENVRAMQEGMTSKIEECLSSGKSIMDIATEFGISMEEVITFMDPKRKTLKESNLSIVTSKNVLFLVVGDEGPLLVCGNDYTLDLIRNRWEEGAKFYLIGAATIGMVEGIVGRFASVTTETFEESPEV